MEAGMKDFFRKIKPMVWEDLSIPTGKCIRVNGKMARLMGMVHILTQTVPLMKENGGKIYKRVKE
jgi:hypothetical protein